MLVSCAMLLTTLPAGALAAEVDAHSGENWIDSADTAWYDNHSDDTALEIATPEELAGLAKLVNEGNDFSGKTITLTGDIDLTGKEWTPIGANKKPFSGTFDGGGRTIRDLVIHAPADNNVGLFGYTSRGEVKHFTLHNADVTGYLEVGAVSGTPYTARYTDISVTGLIRVEGFSYVGGALGKNAYANVTNVDVTGDTGSYVAADSVEDGIAYRTYVGGLIGFTGEGSKTISDCDVAIDVTGSTCDIGGILGMLHYGTTLENCTYAGSLTLTTPGEDEDTQFGALTGAVHNGGSGATAIVRCTATVTRAMSGSQDVTDTLTAHGDFYGNLGDGGNTGTVSIQATVNGREVTVDNCVARVGGERYRNLADAFSAVTSGPDRTVTLLADVKVSNWSTVRDLSGVTVEGEGHRLTLSAQAFHSAGGNTFRNLKVDLSGAKQGGSAFTAAPGDTFIGVSILGNSSLQDGILITGSEAPDETITIDGCTFDTMSYGIHDSESGDVEQLIVKNSTFTGGARFLFRSPNGQLTGNTLDGVQLDVMGEGQSVTGNTFTNGSSISFYTDGSTFQNNEIQSESCLEFTGADGQSRNLSGNAFGQQIIITTQVASVTITLPEGPAASGRNFRGWSDGAETYQAGDTYTVTQTVTFAAQWEDAPVSGGTSSGSGNQVETTTHPDGSVTTTVTRPNGSVTETTTDPTGNKIQTVTQPNGSSETTVTNTDGSASVTTVDQDGKSETQVKLPAAVVDAAQESGGTVILPMPGVSASTDTTTAPVVKVELGGSTTAKVEIPVEKVTPGTVAVIVKADGTEEVIKTTLTTENGVAVALSDGDTVKIVDNTKRFDDVADSHWGVDAIDFATSRELFQGTSATTFSPEQEMTRAMIVTVLARYDGVNTDGTVWYEAGQKWAMESGISDGTNMDASVSREQLAVMLWRYAGSPAISGGLSQFADSHAVSDWAASALAWAVEAGLINGMGDGTLAPQAEATRAQVAAMLTRFVQYANQ